MIHQPHSSPSCYWQSIVKQSESNVIHRCVIIIIIYRFVIIAIYYKKQDNAEGIRQHTKNLFFCKMKMFPNILLKDLCCDYHRHRFLVFYLMMFGNRQHNWYRKMKKLLSFLYIHDFKRYPEISHTFVVWQAIANVYKISGFLFSSCGSVASY